MRPVASRCLGRRAVLRGFAATEAAARATGVAVHRAPLKDAGAVDAAVSRVLPVRPQGILVLTSPILLRAQPRLAQLAVQHRLASISGVSTFPDDGGPMAYGPNFPAIWRQAAGYVDRILKSARPGDLPIERPAKFEFRINAPTAKALSLDLPPMLRARADEVLE